MKRPPSVVTLGIAAGGLVAMLSGCSLLGGSDGAQPIPGKASDLSPSTSISLAPSASPSASVKAVAPTPPTVAGYTLAAPKDTVTHKFQTVAGQFANVYSGLTSRTIVKGNQQVGSLVLLGLQPDLVGNTAVEQRLVPGMVKGMSGEGAKVTQQKVGTQSVAVAITKSTNIVAWYRGGTLVLVLGNGTDATSSLAFTKSYLAAS